MRYQYKREKRSRGMQACEGAGKKGAQRISDDSDTHQVGPGTLGNGSTGQHSTGVERS